MSAYRTLSAQDIDTVRQLAVADAVVDCLPITAGIENSNWFVTLLIGAQRQRCVLTIVEGVPADELPFFVALTDTLAEADLPVPMALSLLHRQRQFALQGKPAMLLPRMPGSHLEYVTTQTAAAAGSTLAQLHAAATRCPLRRERPDHRWWPAAFASLAPLLEKSAHDELAAALLAASTTFASVHALPHGIIHGDFFRDNVLVTGTEITAVLDFFHATDDLLAWDIAIALNDWAVAGSAPDAALATAFVDGYECVRTLTAAEHAVLPALRRAAAARFWLSRLLAMQTPAQTNTVQRKNPDDMRDLYRALARC